MLAAIAEDAVATHSSTTDGTWKFIWTLQDVQAHTADHDLCLSCVYSQSFLLHCFFPSQEPPDTFLGRFSHGNKVISIEVLPGDPRAEIMWHGFDNSSKMMKSSGLSIEPWWTPTFTINSSLYPLPTWTRLPALIGIHPLHQLHNPLLHTKFSQHPPDDLPRCSIKGLLQVY